MIFQTLIIWSTRVHSLKYLRSTTLGYKDMGIRKSEFVTKTQFLCLYFEKLIPSPSLLRLIILMRRGGEAVCTYPQACMEFLFNLEKTEDLSFSWSLQAFTFFTFPVLKLSIGYWWLKNFRITFIYCLTQISTFYTSIFFYLMQIASQ